MFKFIIVEDDEPALRQLKSLLSEEFPDSSVHTAKTVEEGDERLQVSVREGRNYDAALLDFMLPKFQGEPAEIDHSLCEKIRSKSQGTLVIHMTAFGEDREVVKHLAEAHSEPSGPWFFLISKSTSDWPLVLLKTLRTFLYSREISEQMEHLFGYSTKTSTSSRAEALRRPAVRKGGVTHRLAVLQQSIAEHWPDLTESLKARIHETFVVNITEDEVHVSLI
jgi:CheY-like chemotaxis protein